MTLLQILFTHLYFQQGCGLLEGGDHVSVISLFPASNLVPGCVFKNLSKGMNNGGAVTILGQCFLKKTPRVL